MQKLLERWLPAAGGVVCVILLGLNVQRMFGNMRTLQALRLGCAYPGGHCRHGQRPFAAEGRGDRPARLPADGDARDLEPCNDAVVAINDQVNEVQKLSADNGAQQAPFPELRERGLDAARQALMNDQGKIEMDAVRRRIRDMKRDEERLLEECSQRAQYSYRRVPVSGVLAGTAAYPPMHAGRMFSVGVMRRTPPQAAHLIGSKLPRVGFDLDNLRWHRGDGGAPIPDEDVLASFECERNAMVSAGDHEIVLGRVAGETTPVQAVRLLPPQRYPERRRQPLEALRAAAST